MIRAEHVARLALAFLVLYVGLIVYQGEDYERNNVFPFAPWSVFSHVPDPTGDDFGLRLTEVRGRPVEPTVYYEKAAGIVSEPSHPDAIHLIRRIGFAAVSGDTADLEAARKVLEGRFLGNLRPASYEIVRRRFDVVERVRCDCYLRERTVAAFEAP